MRDIVSTLNIQGKNRGLVFDVEMVPFCGKAFRVNSIVRRIIDEKSGKMLEMKSPCVALEGVYCRGEYSIKRLLCPRAIMPVWRPLWLEKIDEANAAPSAVSSEATTGHERR